MKIQLNQAWQDGAIVFPRFAVLEMNEAAALALIAEGYGHRVPDDTRLFVSETLITECVTPSAPLAGPIEPTGEELTLEEIQLSTGKVIKVMQADDIPEKAKEEARKQERGFFSKK